MESENSCYKQTHRGPKPLIESPSTIRVVIVEGSLEEVLAVLHKLSKDAGESEAVEPEVGGTDQHTQGNGHPPEKDTGAMPVLSLRERAIVAHLMEGHANKEIAPDLGIAHDTVKAHVKNITSKLGVANRTQAAMWGKAHITKLMVPPLPIVSRPQPIIAGRHRPDRQQPTLQQVAL